MPLVPARTWEAEAGRAMSLRTACSRTDKGYTEKPYVCIKQNKTNKQKGRITKSVKQKKTSHIIKCQIKFINGLISIWLEYSPVLHRYQVPK